MNFFLKHIRFKGIQLFGLLLFFSLFSIMVVYSTAGFLDVINHSVKLIIGIIASVCCAFNSI